MERSSDPKPVLGLVTPGGGVSPEAQELYGDVVQHIAAPARVARMREDGYEAAVKEIPGAAQKLAGQGAQAIGLMGTSLTFFRGRAFNEELQAKVREQTHLPVTTMASAIIDGLKAFGTKRVAVATAYSDDVTARLLRFLEEYGLDPVGVENMGIVEMADIRGVTTDDIVALGKKALSAGAADAILVSCGGLRTLDATDSLEAGTGLPVVSSSIAGAWASVRLLGLSGRAARGGRLCTEAR